MKGGGLELVQPKKANQNPKECWQCVLSQFIYAFKATNKICSDVINSNLIMLNDLGIHVSIEDHKKQRPQPPLTFGSELGRTKRSFYI